MKVTIDEDLCTGCGLCEETCEEVFDASGDVAKVKTPTVPEDSEEAAQQAADDCPANAITVK